MPLLSTAVALQRCHVLSSIARSRMLPARTTFQARVLRGMRTLPGLLTIIRPIAPGSTPFTNECDIGRCMYFHSLFLHLELFQNCLDGLNQNDFKTLPMFIFIRKIPNHIQYPFLFADILPNSFKISKHGTHGSKISGDTTNRVNSILDSF